LSLDENPPTVPIIFREEVPALEEVPLPSPISRRRKHLIVFVHGLGGSSYQSRMMAQLTALSLQIASQAELRLFANHLYAFYPDYKSGTFIIWYFIFGFVVLTETTGAFDLHMINTIKGVTVNETIEQLGKQHCLYNLNQKCKQLAL